MLQYRFKDMAIVRKIKINQLTFEDFHCLSYSSQVKIAGQPEFPLYYDNTLARATVGLNRSEAKYIITSRIFSHKSLPDIIFKSHF